MKLKNGETFNVGYEIITGGNSAGDTVWTSLTDPPINPEILNTFRARFDFKENEEEMAKGSEAYSSKTGTRQLYNVFVVDPEGDGLVVFEKMRVIATSEEAAKMKAVHEAGKVLEKDLDDYDFIVEDVGDWGSIRPKV